MSNKPTKATFEQLLAGEVNQVSILNEPNDYIVDFTAEPPLTAREIADRRWHMTKQ